MVSSRILFCGALEQKAMEDQLAKKQRQLRLKEVRLQEKRISHDQCNSYYKVIDERKAIKTDRQLFEKANTKQQRIHSLTANWQQACILSGDAHRHAQETHRLRKTNELVLRAKLQYQRLATRERELHALEIKRDQMELYQRSDKERQALKAIRDDFRQSEREDARAAGETFAVRQRLVESQRAWVAYKSQGPAVNHHTKVRQSALSIEERREVRVDARVVRHGRGRREAKMIENEAVVEEVAVQERHWDRVMRELLNNRTVLRRGKVAQVKVARLQSVQFLDDELRLLEAADRSGAREMRLRNTARVPDADAENMRVRGAFEQAFMSKMVDISCGQADGGRDFTVEGRAVSQQKQRGDEEDGQVQAADHDRHALSTLWCTENAAQPAWSQSAGASNGCYAWQESFPDDSHAAPRFISGRRHPASASRTQQQWQRGERQSQHSMSGGLGDLDLLLPITVDEDVLSSSDSTSRGSMVSRDSLDWVSLSAAANASCTPDQGRHLGGRASQGTERSPSSVAAASLSSPPAAPAVSPSVVATPQKPNDEPFAIRVEFTPDHTERVEGLAEEVDASWRNTPDSNRRNLDGSALSEVTDRAQYAFHRGGPQHMPRGTQPPAVKSPLFFDDSSVSVSGRSSISSGSGDRSSSRVSDSYSGEQAVTTSDAKKELPQLSESSEHSTTSRSDWSGGYQYCDGQGFSDLRLSTGLLSASSSSLSSALSDSGVPTGPQQPKQQQVDGPQIQLGSSSTSVASGPSEDQDRNQSSQTKQEDVASGEDEDESSLYGSYEHLSPVKTGGQSPTRWSASSQLSSNSSSSGGESGSAHSVVIESIRVLGEDTVPRHLVPSPIVSIASSSSDSCGSSGSESRSSRSRGRAARYSEADRMGVSVERSDAGIASTPGISLVYSRSAEYSARPAHPADADSSSDSGGGLRDSTTSTGTDALFREWDALYQSSVALAQSRGSSANKSTPSSSNFSGSGREANSHDLSDDISSVGGDLFREHDHSSRLTASPGAANASSLDFAPSLLLAGVGAPLPVAGSYDSRRADALMRELDNLSREWTGGESRLARGTEQSSLQQSPPRIDKDTVAPVRMGVMDDSLDLRSIGSLSTSGSDPSVASSRQSARHPVSVSSSAASWRSAQSQLETPLLYSISEQAAAGRSSISRQSVNSSVQSGASQSFRRGCDASDDASLSTLSSPGGSVVLTAVTVLPESARRNLGSSSTFALSQQATSTPEANDRRWNGSVVHRDAERSIAEAAALAEDAWDAVEEAMSGLSGSERSRRVVQQYYHQNVTTSSSAAERTTFRSSSVSYQYSTSEPSRQPGLAAIARQEQLERSPSDLFHRTRAAVLASTPLTPHTIHSPATESSQFSSSAGPAMGVSMVSTMPLSGGSTESHHPHSAPCRGESDQCDGSGTYAESDEESELSEQSLDSLQEYRRAAAEAAARSQHMH